MRKLILFITVFWGINFSLFSAYFSELPYTITQPNGEEIDCFVSGDEFFNWLHDKEGYTIIQAPDGYFYYGETSGNIVIPTSYKVNTVDPGAIGLEKWAKISIDEYQKAQDSYAMVGNDESISNAPHTGTLNNIVIYIRFADDNEFSSTRQSFDDKFNQPAPGISIKSYYDEVSYNQFNINSTHYPDCAMNTNLSYQDSHVRAYFEPYNETTNPIGYEGGSNGSERRSREHTLLKDAIDWVNANSPISALINLDGDNDNNVDNVCFNIVGGNGAWASLLWAHSWSLYSQYVSINGKRVYKYTFQPETQVSVKTLCHEMFHAIGAPDLYHYTGNGISPVSSWDLMEQGFGHMGAYMKWKYANHTWIESIPEITTSGTYTLNPLASSTNNCFKIPSVNNSSQFYVVEYRRKVSGTFENNVPGSGLLVYRIDPTRNGNASGPPDEVYIYRPNGTTTANGSPYSAFFSSEAGRTEINDATNPSGFLQDGSPGGLNISNITSADNTISFDLTINFITNPSNFTASALSEDQINLEWQKNGEDNDIILVYNNSQTFGTPVDGLTYSAGSTISGSDSVIYVGSNTNFTHTGLDPQTTYFYKLYSVDDDNNYSEGITQNATTPFGLIKSFPWTEGFENGEIIPSYWTQEMGGSQGNDGWWLQNGNGGSNPASAYSGYFNACIRDFTTEDNFVTLISPAFDLSNLLSPTLSFWHTQAESASNQDELRIYYKTSSRGESVLLESYTTNISTWTKETISLPNASSDYYIICESNTKAGSGICIDEIEIDGIPFPAVPPTLEVINESVGDDEIACYDAEQTITVAGNSSFVNLQSGSSVNFIAGESIRFLPGFYAHEGAFTHAYITTNSSFCEQLPASIVASESIAMKSNDGIKIPTSENNCIPKASLKVFPNPNKGSFTIELKNMENQSQIMIFNAVGEIIFQKNTNESSLLIDLINAKQGIYFVKAYNNSQQFNQKIIIK